MSQKHSITIELSQEDFDVLSTLQRSDLTNTHEDVARILLENSLEDVRRILDRNIMIYHARINTAAQSMFQGSEKAEEGNTKN